MSNDVIETPVTSLERWELVPGAVESAREIRIDVDGEPVATVFARLLEEGAVPAAGRHVLAAVPVAFRIGEPGRVTLRDMAGDGVVAEADHVFEDRALDKESGLVGVPPVLEGRTLSGWIAQGDRPVVIACLCDGREIARTVASQPVPELAGQAVGYRVVLSDLPAAGEADLKVVALLPRGQRVLGAMQCRTSGTEAGLQGELDAAKPCRVSGRVAIPGGVDGPVRLSLAVNGEDRLFTVTDAAQGGAFSFQTGDLAMIDPVHDEVEIYENLYGLPLRNVPADFIRESIKARIDIRAEEETPVLVLTGCVPLRDLFEVWVEFEDHGDMACIPLAPGKTPCEVTAKLGGRLGDETRVRLAEDGPSLVVSKDVRLRRPQKRAGLGEWVPARKRRVANALRLLAGDPVELQGSADTPDFGGIWEITPPGILRGWALDLKEPFRRFDLDVFAGATRIATLHSDQEVPLVGSQLPGRWPIGFETDLRGVAMPAGNHKIKVRLAGSDQVLRAVGRSVLQWPLPGKKAHHIRDVLTGLQAAPMADEDRLKLLQRLPEKLACQVEMVFTGHRPKRSGFTGERLGIVLCQLAGTILSDPAFRGALADPSRPLPHHAMLTPLLGVDMSGFIAALPLTEQHCAALQACTTWRELLLKVLDPGLFAHLMDASHPEGLLTLQLMGNLRAGLDDVDPELSVGFCQDQGREADIPDILREAERLVISDERGLVLLDEAVKPRSPAPRILERFWRPMDHGAEIPLYIAAQTAAGWRLSRLRMQERDAVPAPRISRVLTVEQIVISGNMVELTCSGGAEPEALSLNIAGTPYELMHLPSADAEQRLRRYAGRIAPLRDTRLRLAAADCGAGEYDLRIGGARPGGLPAEIEVDTCGGLRVSGPDQAGGALTGAVSSTIPEAGKVVLSLSGLQPDAVDPAAGDPVLPQRLAQAGVPARLPPEPARFALRLPAVLLDGLPWRLSMSAWPEGAEDEAAEIWSGTFQATEDVLAGQLRDLDEDLDGCRDFLIRIAQAGRIAFIGRVFADLPAHTAHVFDAPVTFEILAAALYHAEAPVPERLQALFDNLWTFAATSPGRLQDFVARARATLIAARKDGTLRRYPTSPAGEALTDLLQLSQPRTGDEAYRRFTDALGARRFALARAILEQGLRKFDGNPRLLVGQSALALQLGDARAAEAHARAALAAKGKFREAQVALSRALSRQGRDIEALATLTGGAGLSAWIGKIPDYDQVKQAAPLDPAGAFATVAASRGGEIQALAERMAEVEGPACSLAGSSYSLFFLPGTAEEFGHAALFRSLREAGQCTQVGTLENWIMSEVECTGDYAFLFAVPRKITPALLEMIFAQKRAAEPVIRLVSCPLDEKGAPTKVQPAGAVIRADMLRAFGAVAFEDYLEHAERALRVKTVLI